MKTISAVVGCVVVGLLLIGLLGLPLAAQQTYAEQATLAADAVFQSRVQVAMEGAAIAIVNEDPGTANHASRAALASRVLSDPMNWRVRFAPAVTADVTITAAASDAAIFTRVSAVWNAFGAGGC